MNGVLGLTEKRTMKPVPKTSPRDPPRSRARGATWSPEANARALLAWAKNPSCTMTDLEDTETTDESCEYDSGDQRPNGTEGVRFP